MIIDILCEKCRSTLTTIDTDDYDAVGSRDTVWVPICDYCLDAARETARIEGWKEGRDEGYDRGWQEGKDDAMENY